MGGFASRGVNITTSFPGKNSVNYEYIYTCMSVVVGFSFSCIRLMNYFNIKSAPSGCCGERNYSNRNTPFDVSFYVEGEFG